MLDRESGPKRLSHKLSLNSYPRKWVGTLDEESGLKQLTKKVALNT